MSERGHFRGARARASHRGGSGARGAPAPPDKKKENILDLAKYLEQGVRVKFSGGREVTGTLKGYDQLMNLVLDDVHEATTDDAGNRSTRALGLLVARGTLLVMLAPVDGSEEIANPFVQDE